MNFLYAHICRRIRSATFKPLQCPGTCGDSGNGEFVAGICDGGGGSGGLLVADICGGGDGSGGLLTAGICDGGNGSGSLLVADICGGGDGSGGLLTAGICGGADGNCCEMPEIKANAIAIAIKMTVFILIHFYELSLAEGVPDF